MSTNCPDVLRKLNQKQRSGRDEDWHILQVIVPRRSITGRLLRGSYRGRDEKKLI
jgi:hypothetical protein